MKTTYKIFSLRYVVYSLVLLLSVSTYWFVSALNTIGAWFQTTASNTTIDAHNECRQVRHTWSQSYFVPTRTSAEWTAFRNNHPSDISIQGCAAWWEEIGMMTGMFSDYHATVVTWWDGTTAWIIDGNWYPGRSIGRQGSVNLRSATSYNAETWECSPAKSYIWTGDLIQYWWNWSYIFTAEIQVCGSNGIASAPISNPFSSF